MAHEQMGCDDLLKKIQELQFAAVDLNLFLDNNPENRNAVADYNAISRELTKLKKIYEMEHGPLLNFGSSESPYPWSWVNEPWPWEINE